MRESTVISITNSKGGVGKTICLLCGGNRLPPHRGGQRTPKLFLRRIWRKDSFGVRRNKGGGAAGVLFSVRDVDVLRLLCWCQNIRPQDLNSISTKAERENLMALRSRSPSPTISFPWPRCSLPSTVPPAPIPRREATPNETSSSPMNSCGSISFSAL